MKKLVLCFLLIVTAACEILHAQDTLPKFSAKDVGNNRIILSWTNMFENIRQLSIQRSFDSLTNYKTILTVPDPTTPQNGFMDTRAQNNHMFYRLYILLEKGVYLFSESKRPEFDSLRKTEFVQNKIKLAFPDSAMAGNLKIPDKILPMEYVPSRNIYTDADGYVRIKIRDNELKKYSIKFFEEDNSFLFELKDIKEKSLKIDKANFYHAGLFWFELYEEGKLIEKNKFYLQKDF